MSEEILQAMMELFAIIVKQDGGMVQNELNSVKEFLSAQLPHKGVDKYLQLFLDNAGPLQKDDLKKGNVSPSVKDSLRVLNNCQIINKTLTREQKVIVLLRCLELVNSDKQYTSERMNIINTISEVFRICEEELTAMMQFVRGEERKEFSNQSMIVISTQGAYDHDTGSEEIILFLRVTSVNLCFLKCFTSATTELNGLPVKNGKVYSFAPGSYVEMFPGSKIYYSDIISRFTSSEYTSPILFEADKLNHLFADGTRAITNVSFSAREGMLVGIMGASGSGKTTLMTLLTGLLKPTSGQVRLNGVSLNANDGRLEGVMGYVSQDDLLIEELTLFDNLFYAASFCFADKTGVQITEIVNQSLRSLGLYEQKDYRVGSPLNKVISGGQRKRLNIALELIREPSILFLDEPTSGLSSSDSENVMDLLKELTRKGKLVITVIHQPSSDIYKSLDRVLLLDQEGQLAYYGNPLDAIVHFKTIEAYINSGVSECPECGNVNPEILFNILETKVVDEFGKYTAERRVSPDEWARAFRKKTTYDATDKVTESPLSSLRKPGWLHQSLLYLKRDVKSKIANRQYLLLTLLEGPLLGIILAFIIRYIADPSSDIYIFRENENIPVYIFMGIIVALFMGLTISAEEIFRDRKMLARERFLNLSQSSYLISKVMVLAFISALQTFLFLIVANPILGIKGLFFSYWLALFATALVANLTGLNISSAFNSAIAIYIIIPLLMIPMMVLSGAMFPFDKLNRRIARADRVPVIAELMPTRWTYEALMVRQFKGNDYGRRIYPHMQQMSISDFNAIYRIPRIVDALENVTDSDLRAGNIDKWESEMRLLKNETVTIDRAGIIESFSGADSITPELFSENLALKIRAWLLRAGAEYRTLSNLADRELDKYTVSNKTELELLYNNYHNDRLEEIVRKVYEKHKMLEFRERLIQNVELIYLEPTETGPMNFRTHFMAPVKRFMGMRIDTYWFNISLVFTSLIVLYIMLYTGVIRKSINQLEKRFGYKRKR